MTDLKACPFCEGEAYVNEPDEHYDIYTECKDCSCKVRTCGQRGYDKQYAIDNWNTRPIEDAAKPDSEFTVRVAHILLKDGMTDSQKLDCIKLRYREMAFPENPLTEIEQQLVDYVYRNNK